MCREIIDVKVDTHRLWKTLYPACTKVIEDHNRIVSSVRNHTKDVADLRFELGVENNVAQTQPNGRVQFVGPTYCTRPLGK